MAWLFSPLTFSYLSCGWKHTTSSPVDDYRIPGFNHFSACPQCDGEVDSRSANAREIAAVQLGQLAKILRRR